MTPLRLPIRLTLAAALLAGTSTLLVSPQAAAPDRAWITVLSTTEAIIGWMSISRSSTSKGMGSCAASR